MRKVRLRETRAEVVEGLVFDRREGEGLWQVCI